MVLGIVTLGVFALLVPTVMRYLDQRAELVSLNEQLTTLEQENADLEAELARWDDKSFVIAQARERLSYVFPGETAYRVIDPESVVVPVQSDQAPVLGDQLATLATTGERQTWYSNVWQSVQIAGTTALATDDTADADAAANGEEPAAGEDPAGQGETDGSGGD